MSAEADVSQKTRSPNSNLLVTRFTMLLLSATDIGALAGSGVGADRYLKMRGRPGWLEEVRSKFALLEPWGFGVPTVDSSSYQRTDRHGRRTFSGHFVTSYMPLVFKKVEPKKHRVGPIVWHIDELRLGAAGAVSVRAIAHVDNKGKTVRVGEVVSAFHQIRQALDIARVEALQQFADAWTSAVPEVPLAVPHVDVLRRDSYYYEIVDLDYRVGRTRMNPKELYSSGPLNAMQQLAGLTRMSLVWDKYDEVSVRRMAQFDLGSRADEFWIVNDERLVRSHPDAGDPNIDAFFEDVELGLELVLHQAAVLNWLASWLRENRPQLLDSLLVPGEDGLPAAKPILSQLAAASDLFSDRVRVEDNSGHSFFRHLLTHASDRFQLEDRRLSCRATFTDLFSIAQAVSTQASNEASASVQSLSRRLTAFGAIVALATLFVAALQLYLASQAGLDQLCEGSNEIVVIEVESAENSVVDAIRCLDVEAPAGSDD